MRGYVEMMERLEFLRSRKVSDDEIREALADQIAAEMEYERDFDPPEDDELPEDA